MSFVPLHVYSGFSYLQSGLVAPKIPFLAKKMGYEGCGICDNGTLSGYAPFTHAAKDAGITPVYGMDASLTDGVFSLFVRNEEGYRNLCALTYLASESKLSLQDVYDHAKGLICVYPLESSFLYPRFKTLGKTMWFIFRLIKALRRSLFRPPLLPRKPRVPALGPQFQPRPFL
jgi:DNA polymerase-3 subunit alpha